MFLTKKHLSRRTVLRGAGATLALPLLDAMIPAATALAQTAAAPKLRMGFFYIPHGAIMGNTSYGPEMDRWTPSGAGADFKLSPILAPLDPYKRYVTSFGNLQNEAMAGGVHSLAPATWLSGHRPDRGSAGASMSPTLDQVVAQHIGQGTTLPSLEVASETTQQAAACSGSACFYNTTLSFRDAHSPLPMEYNPRKVFVQLFGEGDTPEERTGISSLTKSLLDRISDRTRALRRDLAGSADQFPQDVQELQSYFEAPAGQSTRAIPGAGLEVPIWLLGSSLFSAQLAAALGLPFAFAAHFAPELLLPALALYRRGFQASRELARPYAMICINVIAADTDAEARRLFTSHQQAITQLRRGRPGQLPPPIDDIDSFWSSAEKAMVESSMQCSFVGSATAVERGLRAFLGQAQVEELMINVHVYDQVARRHSLTLTVGIRDRLAAAATAAGVAGA